MAQTLTPQQLAALNEELNSPDFRAGYRSFSQTLRAKGHRGAADYKAYLASHGIELPHDYQIDQRPDGRLEAKRNSFLLRNPWMFPAAAVGGGLAAGALAGGAAAAPAAAGGGVGVGEAAAVSGLAGSGLDAAGDIASGGMDFMKMLGPLLGLGTTLAVNQAGSSNGMDPGLQSQVSGLIGEQTARARRTTPVHEAAMRLAQQLAPTGASSPRLDAAVRESARPAQPTGMDPAVMDALQRLSGRI